MKETMTYTEAKNQLEEIVNDLQNNQLTVDELSSKIKEAVGLITQAFSFIFIPPCRRSDPAVILQCRFPCKLSMQNTCNPKRSHS